PSSVNEGATATYTATATYSDSSKQTVTPTWGASAGSISSAGLFTAPQVTANQTVSLSASFGGVSAPAYPVTVVNVPGDATDKVPPTVISNLPLDLAVSVTVEPAIAAAFSEPIDPSSLNTGTFRVLDSAMVPLPGVVTYNETSRTATFSPAGPLSYGNLYTVEVGTGVEDLAGNGMATAYRWTFTTEASAPDSDDDGVGDPDDEYPHDCRNATPKTPRGNGKIRIELSASSNGCLKKVKTSPENSLSVNQAEMPVGYEFPDGLLYYQVEGISPGSTETVTLTYPRPLGNESKVYKNDSEGFWELSGATINGKTVTLTVTDGGTGDQDGVRNGVISDPVGVAVPAEAGDGGSIDLSSSAPGGGGCSVSGNGGRKDLSGVLLLLAVAWWGLAALRRSRKRRV
ncbi:MAG TPA: Ig-like domain-containing protein, partial [Candidatus Deferrimicrobiaceae bacterium]